VVVGESGGLKSGPTVQPDTTTVSIKAAIGTSELRMFGIPRRISSQRLIRADQEI
jgi:hypothetical protein